MRIAYSLQELSGLPDAGRPSVVTIGNFDGVHAGHQSVIAAVRKRASVLNARSVVVTFEPHPSHVVKTELRTAIITPLARKLELLAEQGLDLVLVLPFTETLRELSAAEFVQRVLCDGLHTVEIHEGKTFRFGHRAEADIHALKAFGEAFCFRVIAYEPVVRRAAPVSSSRIRSLVARGDVETARVLLGRPLCLESTPASGRGYGTRYAVPTINLARPSGLLPAHGVYITTLQIGAGSQAVTFRGVTNAGDRPTFGAASYAIETHLLNFVPVDLTMETPLRLCFLHRLRAEQRFTSAQALKQQIELDVLKSLRFFRLCDALGIA